jgi:hypothetical protein
MGWVVMWPIIGLMLALAGLVILAEARKGEKTILSSHQLTLSSAFNFLCHCAELTGSRQMNSDVCKEVKPQGLKPKTL